MSKLKVATFTNIGYRFHARRFTPMDVDLAGKTVVITGATGGLGLESARSLAGMGARVIVVGRDQTKLEAAQNSIDGQVSTIRADLSLMAEVRMLAETLLEAQPRVDVLINNVGVLLPERQVTEEGVEATLATNLAGHFLLTNLLIPRLIESAPARIINVSSGGMYSEPIRPDDIQFELDPYTGTAAYARTKRGQVILTEMWAEKLLQSGVVVHSMHPGWAKTQGVADSLPTFDRVMRPFLRTPAQGADTIVWLAAAAEPGRTSGRFWFDREVAPTHLIESTKETDRDRALLWEELVGITGADVPRTAPS